MHEPATQPTVGMYACNNTPAQTWRLDSNGLVTYAGAEGTSLPDLCLEPQLNGSKSGGNILIQPCKSTSNQQWKVSGGSLIHRDTGLCMGIAAENFTTADGFSFPRPIVATCNAVLYSQKWALGAADAALETWKTTNAARTLQDKCSPSVVLGAYVATDPGAKRFINRYGSLAATLEVIKKALLSNCAQMYATGAEVPVVDRITLNFWATYANPPGAAWVIGDSAGKSFNIYGPYWATVDESEQPFSGRTDSVIHHELTHVLDWGYGKPRGIVEGYANLIAFRTGYLPASQKKKGGNWTDGYSTSAFFLKWLDDTFMSKPRPQRFTDVMQVQARLQTNEVADPNWFNPWVLSVTGGQTLDQLWRKYQSSF